MSRLSTIIATWLLLAAASLCPAEPVPRFTAARPIWPEGREKEMNLQVGFRAIVDVSPDAERIVLRLTASCVYRASVNGEFLGHGPARGPHGHYRVDEWDMSGHARPGANVIAIEVAGYNLDGFYLLNQPSFLQAEVVQDGKVLAATGTGDRPFRATILTERVQKVQRYSQQRTFTEVYRLQPGHDRWRHDPGTVFDAVSCSTFAEVPLLPRRVPYPRFHLRQPVSHLAAGTLRPNAKADERAIESFLRTGLHRGGYQPDQFEARPAADLWRTPTHSMKVIDAAYAWDMTLPLKKEEFRIVDLGTNLTGFIGARITCSTKTRLYFTFDEILTSGDVDFHRSNAVANIVTYELAPGTYEVESFEPYTLRYLKLSVLEGACEIDRVHLRELTNPEVDEAYFAASDERLNRLFAAGRETFRQNALDIFMDCPSRERAGWLCDSFFTARVALDLSGRTAIEHNFYENFLLPDTFKNLPEGMLPMCYPAERLPNEFIPNWALWFVVELEEYWQRSHDRETVDALKPKIEKLFEYFQRFRNSDGLLEKIESWVFIEWSAANSFVQDVNYPSNMLFAGALAAAGRLYDEPNWLAEADRLREVIRRQSFDGRFFVDNAVRTHAGLQVTRNRTETCQYYAFFFDVATPESHPRLWKVVCEQFGPQRSQTHDLPEIHPANAFIGNVLRLEILSRYRRSRQVLAEAVDYHLYMADRTGTLWENIHPGASCNHGFASHLNHVLYRDVLGLWKWDPVHRTITLRFSDHPLKWCEGCVPTPDGPIRIRWWREGTEIRHQVCAPAGYCIEVEPATDDAILAH